MPTDKKSMDRLRALAETRQRRNQTRNGNIQSPDLSVEELIHEIEVHQIELEMQNEELVRTQENLKHALSRYSDLYDLAPVGYLCLYQNGCIQSANLTLATMLDVDRMDLPSARIQDFVSPDDQDVLLLHLRAVFQSGTLQRSELELITRAGKKIFVQLESIVQAITGDDKPWCLTVVTDITVRHEQEVIIEHQANYDALTDLPNRALFMDRLEYSIRTAKREHHELALFFIDLDDFKLVNDTYGHAIGDQVLVELSKRMRACARKNDTLARLSGDEFSMLLPHVNSPSGVALVAEKILKEIEAELGFSDASFRVSCSIGIAKYPHDGKDAEAILKAADLALYKVKRSGRRHYAFYESKMNNEIAWQRNIQFNLKQAIKKEQLLLRYQPVIDLKTQKPIGCEALIRWHHPELGAPSPEDFIPIAELDGTIIKIGEWTIQQAIQQSKQWIENGVDPGTVWVNLSVKHCKNAELLGRLLSMIKSYIADAGHLKLGLEITEHDIFELSEATTGVFDRLHDMGIGLSLDDFGSGFSSLSSLLHMPIDLLKIDRIFISKLEDNVKVSNMVQSIIALGHSMNARVVAEGVETEEQLEKVKALDCDFAQGFRLAKPLSPEEYEAFIASASEDNG